MLLASYYHFSWNVEQFIGLFFFGPASFFFFLSTVFDVHLFIFFSLGLKLEVEYCLANMLKPLDPFWQYGELEDETNQQRLSCKLCGQPMIGGVS
jgi:hypothetical protein